MILSKYKLAPLKKKYIFSDNMSIEMGVIINMATHSIIFESNGSLFSLPSENVESIINLTEITELPNSQSSVRGITRYRDTIYTVIDFRVLTSQKSMMDELSEFIAMLDQRETDHINWLHELENSVDENRLFSLETNPHNCAFGKWYYSYKSDNISIRKILHKFEEPHAKIHKIAEKIEKLKQEGNFTEAKKLIEFTKGNELNTLKKLFSELRQDAHHLFKESAILLHIDKRKIALIVDKIISVDNIVQKEITNLNDNNIINFNENFVTGIADTENEKMVLTLSEEALFSFQY